MVTQWQHRCDKKHQLVKFQFFEKVMFLDRLGNHMIPLTIQTTILLMEKTQLPSLYVSPYFNHFTLFRGGSNR